MLSPHTVEQNFRPSFASTRGRKLWLSNCQPFAADFHTKLTTTTDDCVATINGIVSIAWRNSCAAAQFNDSCEHNIAYKPPTNHPPVRGGPPIQAKSAMLSTDNNGIHLYMPYICYAVYFAAWSHMVKGLICVYIANNMLYIINRSKETNQTCTRIE